MFAVGPTFFSNPGDHPAGDGLTIFQTAFAGGVSNDISVSNLGAGVELGPGIKAAGYYEADFDAVSTFNRGIVWYADADLSLGTGNPLTCEMFFTCIELVSNPASSGKIFQLQFGTPILDVYLQPFTGSINPIGFAYGGTTFSSTTDAFDIVIRHLAMVYRPSNTLDTYLDGTRLHTLSGTAGAADGQIQMGGSNTVYADRWRMQYRGGRVRRAEVYSGASFTPPASPAAWGPP